jgi:penicillin-binding protein 2
MIQAPLSPAAYKIQYLFWATCAVFVMIAARLFVLQITQTETFTKQGQRNFIRTEKIASPRGNIVDRNGILLVTNRPVNSLYWNGSGNRTFTIEQREIITELEQILGINIYQNEASKTEIQQAERRYKKFLLTRDLTMEQLGKLQERIPEHPNLIIDTDFERLYPYNSFASHILGYLSGMNTNHEGRMGIEKVCDELLKGQDGSTLKIINSFGKSLSETTIEQPNVGAEIKTTIDATLQSIVEEVLPKMYTGAFIIMNPADGGILALTSQPNFDPNIFLRPILPDEWQTIQSTKQPFLNRAFSAHYPPGSIFKLVTLSAALENGMLTQDSTVYCSGNHSFAGRKYWCHNKHGHGRLTAVEALEHSCNIMCYEIARRIDIDILADYAYRFGLGQKTESLFPEKEGLVPSRVWKRSVKGEKWWPGETLSASIGQSFLLVTPIQVARMIGSIFTRYLVKPRILADEPIEKKPLNIRLETLEFLRNSMQKVVTTGTGRMSRVKDVHVYAKTSTAQNSDLSKREMGEQFLEHGWFVSHFSYKNHPPLTIVIILENVGSSSVAVAVAKNFFVEYKKRMDQSSL